MLVKLLNKIVVHLSQFDQKNKLDTFDACMAYMKERNINDLKKDEVDLKKFLVKLQSTEYELEALDDLMSLYKILARFVWVVEQTNDDIWRLLSKVVKEDK